MGPGVQELFAAIAAQGVAPSGAWFTRHFAITPTQWDFEISVPVERRIEPMGRVVPSELGERTVARAIYRGPYEGLAAAWGKLDAWIRAEGHERCEDLWECYLCGPESGLDSSAYATELNRPIVV